MAISGSFKNTIHSLYTLRVEWAATQSTTNNTSALAVTAYLDMAKGGSLYVGARSDNKINANSKDYTFSSPAISNGGGSAKTVKLGSINTSAITHNADGTKSITITATYYIRATLSGTYYESITASATVTLNTIPRATTPTLSASSIDMGATLTINTPRASSSFTHDLAYSFAGSGWVAIATGVATSKSWTVPDLAASIPAATSGVMTIRCITKNGSAAVGTKTVTLTVKVPTNVVPTVSALTAAEAVAGIAARFENFVQHKSKATVNITGAGVKGSSITAYQATLEGTNYTAASFTTNVLTTSGTVVLKARVKDSRGRWSAWKTLNLTVYPYTQPQIQQFFAYRVDENGNSTDSGQYIAIRQQYSVASVNTWNTITATIKYKRSIDSSYTTLSTNTSVLSIDNTEKPKNKTFSTDYEYEIVLTVKDWFGTASETSASVVIPTDEVILDIKENGKGIAFGKTAEFDGIDFGWDIVGTIAETALLEGRYKNHDGLLIQWGTVNITPGGANLPASVRIDFKEAYKQDPFVALCPRTATPQYVSVATTRDTNVVPDAKKAMGIYVNRSDGVVQTAISWLAVGLAAN